MADGGVVTFACDGTIRLAMTITITLDTALDATGHQVTISGADTVGVFYVQTNVTFTVNHLTIAHGRSTNGAGIFNANGTVNATNMTFDGNEVLGAAGPPNSAGGSVVGGAVANSGVINLVNCSFTNNSAVGGAGGPGLGMYPQTSGAGGRGTGGAVWNSGLLTGSGCTFAGNSAAGGIGGSGSVDIAGGPGGEGSGGALFNSGVARLVDCSLAFNTGAGGYGGRGSDGFWQTFAWGEPGGAGGHAFGGAICNIGSLWVARSTFASNVVTGGFGGDGGNALADYWGGDGADGGVGAGGALYLGEAASTINCTFAFNTGSGGDGGRGGNAGWQKKPGTGGNGGVGCGGVDGTCNLTNCTIAWNLGNAGLGGAAGSSPSGAGTPGTNGAAWGGTVGSTLVNTLIASNTPAGGDSFTDPKLGPLADNGGPTLTMALLPGSPAIDAGNTSLAPATDQRGVPRPFSLAADIGAFEFWPTLRASSTGSGGIDILASGISGQACRLLASSNFLDWLLLATNQIGTNGTILFYDNYAPGSACRFYRLVIP
jgi:hypothetical protein